MVETPRGNRVHIAIFGRTNAGKSSLINCITNQNISLVSDVKGNPPPAARCTGLEK